MVKLPSLFIYLLEQLHLHFTSSGPPCSFSQFCILAKKTKKKQKKKRLAIFLLENVNQAVIDVQVISDVSYN